MAALDRPRDPLELPERFDAVSRGRVSGEEAAAAGALGLHEPRQRLDHDLLGLPDALEQIDSMLVGLVLLLPAVASRDEGAGHRSELTRTGEDLVEDHRADADARPQGLRLGHVAKKI